MLVINERADVPRSEQRVLDWMRTWTGQYIIVGLAISGCSVSERSEDQAREADLVVITPRAVVVIEVRGTVPDATSGVLSVRESGRWRLSGFDGDPIHVRDNDNSPFEKVTDSVVDLRELLRKHHPDAYVDGLIVVVPPWESSVTLEVESRQDGFGVVLGSTPGELRAWLYRTSNRKLLWTAETVHALLSDLGLDHLLTIEDILAEGFPSATGRRPKTTTALEAGAPEHSAHESAAYPDHLSRPLRRRAVGAETYESAVTPDLEPFAAQHDDAANAGEADGWFGDAEYGTAGAATAHAAAGRVPDQSGEREFSTGTESADDFESDGVARGRTADSAPAAEVFVPVGDAGNRAGTVGPSGADPAPLPELGDPDSPEVGEPVPVAMARRDHDALPAPEEYGYAVAEIAEQPSAPTEYRGVRLERRHPRPMMDVPSVDISASAADPVSAVVPRVDDSVRPEVEADSTPVASALADRDDHRYRAPSDSAPTSDDFVERVPADEPARHVLNYATLPPDSLVRVDTHGARSTALHDGGAGHVPTIEPYPVLPDPARPRTPDSGGQRPQHYPMHRPDHEPPWITPDEDADPPGTGPGYVRPPWIQPDDEAALPVHAPSDRGASRHEGYGDAPALTVVAHPEFLDEEPDPDAVLPPASSSPAAFTDRWSSWVEHRSVPATPLRRQPPLRAVEPVEPPRRHALPVVTRSAAAAPEWMTTLRERIPAKLPKVKADGNLPQQVGAVLVIGVAAGAVWLMVTTGAASYRESVENPRPSGSSSQVEPQGAEKAHPAPIETLPVCFPLPKDC